MEEHPWSKLAIILAWRGWFSGFIEHHVKFIKLCAVAKHRDGYVSQVHDAVCNWDYDVVSDRGMVAHPFCKLQRFRGKFSIWQFALRWFFYGIIMTVWCIHVAASHLQCWLVTQNEGFWCQSRPMTKLMRIWEPQARAHKNIVSKNHHFGYHQTYLQNLHLFG
jgi:hypothetical protein